MSTKVSIAIDGPAGAGKSTVAKLVAEKLGYIYIDTGAMYRAITWKALLNKINPQDEQALAKLAKTTKIEFLFNSKTKEHFVFCDGEDVTQDIRTPKISNLVSDIAKVSGVRAVLLKQQQLLAAKQNVVMDGRDIASNVLPQASYKFFLTASVKERAQRRFKELCSKGYKVTESELAQDIIKRDEADQGRSIAPLVKVPEAIEIDTSCYTPEEVVEIIVLAIKNTKLNC